jgi:catechol 2,3-dioxygenase-like lactoylglutathione lyase family enzyme
MFPPPLKHAGPIDTESTNVREPRGSVTCDDVNPTSDPGRIPVQIGKLFHLTMLVDDLKGPDDFFNSVFSPMCTMRGYSSHWHRHAAMYIIAETSIEPMHVLPPLKGEVPTSWYRFMERYGPRIHNLAFYVDDPDELADRLQAAGVRTTRAGTGTTVFAHPKDTPGMLEFSPTAGSMMLPEPRFMRSWDTFRREYWPNHPLGLERMSHVSILIRDLDQATAFYTDVLDARPLPKATATIEDTVSHYLLVGEDTVVELAQPVSATSAAGRELQDVGEGAVAVTFKLRDIPAAERYLRTKEAPIATVKDQTITLDPNATWGVQFRFSSSALPGDPRS